jgi:3-keto-disaccharide hydrolase
MKALRGFLAITFAAAAFAQTPNTLTSQEQTAGWILLFDGKSMKGWEDPGRRTPPGDSWSIEDGCLKAKSQPRIRQDLFTNETFGDFELTFEWRISKNGNSGLKYHVQDRFFIEDNAAPTLPKKFEDLANYRLMHRLTAAPARGQEYVIGFEYQTIDNASFQPNEHKMERAGSLYDMVAASKDSTRPIGEWNQSRIYVKGGVIQHWLNGVLVVSTSFGSPTVKAGIQRRWGASSPIAKALLNAKPDGKICLQNHGDEAWFRSIKLRRL